MEEILDLVVIGGGPAGLSAALYAARNRKKVLVLERELIGGQMMITASIENMPGSVAEDPFTLTEKMRKQAVEFGAAFKMSEVKSVDLKAEPKRLDTGEGTILAHTVIIATGANPRKLGLENEEKYTGRGVSYCATCDGPFYADMPIYIVGGGDAAFDESIYLTSVSKDITILYRSHTPRATKVLQKRAEDLGIKVLLNTEVVRLSGDENLHAFVMRNKETGEEKTVEGQFGLFIYIGMEPNTSLVEGQLVLSSTGYIDAGEDTKTEIPGVYAAGDVRGKEVRQIVTALADGATAAIHASKYVDQLQICAKHGKSDETQV